MKASTASSTRLSEAARRVIHKPGQPLRTGEQVKAAMLEAGISTKDFARHYNLNPDIVYQVISGKKVGKFGQSHIAAVLLGMKHGFVPAEITR